LAVTFTNILVGEGTLFVGANEGAATDVGATQEGAEIAWEPDMVDIEVDQFGDAARVVQSMVKVSLRTTLAEGTLENLSLAWGYDADEAITTTTEKVFDIGLHGVYPEERFVKLIGNAPGSTATITKARTYRCNRAVQYSASAHMLRRAENTAFPVDFRILPDVTQSGAEYGTITDEL
jgi:hypothetical protein